MSNYKLYGEKLIENDSTLNKFTESLLKGLISDDLKNQYNKFLTNEENNFEEMLEDLLSESLIDDISRTDINYEELLEKYSTSIGEVLFKMENNGYDIKNFPITFFGEHSKDTFEYLITGYIISSLNEKWIKNIIIPEENK